MLPDRPAEDASGSKATRAPSRPLAQVNLQIGDSTRPFFYRPDSTGDRGVIEQIFREGDYRLAKFALSDPLLRLYRDTVAAGRAPLIVDAGANIGASVVYFAGNFPKCRIVAVEPERNNCDVLRTNCRGLNFELLEGGIGAVAGTSFLNDPGRGSFQLHVVPAFHRCIQWAAVDVLRLPQFYDSHPGRFL